ncbi:hypothetical protein SHL15_4256 [Streptomyces hygroscopicus subsp. limoneus]|nr:hypothetical protein SHL15_4256 [Streptomyces hygroscopicus subsp. limoneus]
MRGLGGDQVEVLLFPCDDSPTAVTVRLREPPSAQAGFSAS